jgi:hypothetical protein
MNKSALGAPALSGTLVLHKTRPLLRRATLVLLIAAFAAAVWAAPASAVSFQARHDFTSGASSSPRQVAVADFNGDGFPDLATADAGSGGVSVLLNDGTATATSVGFAAPQLYATGSTPYGVAAGDLNGDNIVDLVVANEGANSVSVLLGKGDGTFVAQPAIPLSSSSSYGPRNAVIADLNGDGHNDIATENQNDDSVSLLINTTSPWPGTSVSFYKDPTSGFPPDYATGTVPYGLVAADFNGDGKADLATANSYCRDSSGARTTATDCGSVSNSVSILLNNGSGNPLNLFAPAANYSTAPNPRSLAVGDFNEDKTTLDSTKPAFDIATANFNVDSVSILLNDGTGRFPSHFEFSSSTYPRSDAVGDVNGTSGAGDGHTDLAVANQNSNTLNVYLGDGKGSFGDGAGHSGVPTGTYVTGNGPFWVAVADVNRDGRQDAITANYLDNTVSVLLNSTTAPPPDFSLSLSPTGQSVVRGSSAQYTVGISRSSFSDPVHLSASGLPSGATATFSPTDTTGISSTLTVTTTPSTKPGGYTFTVTGSSGSLVHTVTGQLNVKRK